MGYYLDIKSKGQDKRKKLIYYDRTKCLSRRGRPATMFSGHQVKGFKFKRRRIKIKVHPVKGEKMMQEGL
jgi:hypothetical protein